MKVRPSTMHYCAQCDDHMSGQITADGGPVFRIGCCFDLEWEGTRDQAAELYDYLESRGYISATRRCRDGCEIPDEDEESYDYDAWTCGVCGENYEEDDTYYNEERGEYVPGKEAALLCCVNSEVPANG